MRTSEACGVLKHLRRREPDSHIHYIHDRVPIAAELAHLLRVYIQQQVSAMRRPRSDRDNIRHLDASSRYCGQNAHQCALRVAIVNVKCMHNLLPELHVRSSEARLATLTRPQTTSPKGPRRPAPSDKHSLPERNRIPATPVPVSAKISQKHPPFPNSPDTPA